jgi:hypothetical protein
VLDLSPVLMVWGADNAQGLCLNLVCRKTGGLPSGAGYGALAFL